MENKTLKHRRELRNNPTGAERHLWTYLRRRQMLGHKFRRQHVIGPYVVDFVCLEKKLVVEIDGSQHLDQERYDQRRSRFLQEQGYRVLRFWNNQVLLQVQVVLRAIEDAIEEPAYRSRNQAQEERRGTPLLYSPPTGESSWGERVVAAGSLVDETERP